MESKLVVQVYINGSDIVEKHICDDPDEINDIADTYLMGITDNYYIVYLQQGKNMTEVHYGGPGADIYLSKDDIKRIRQKM